MTEVASVLFGRQDIRRRVDDLGRAITADYDGREPVLISVLKGGTMFLADLFRSIELPLRVDFMAISRYGDADESFGRVRILMDIEATSPDATCSSWRTSSTRASRSATYWGRCAPAGRPRSRSARCWTSPCAGSHPSTSATPASTAPTASSSATASTTTSATATSATSTRSRT
jgi:hypothetical protein